MRKKMKAFVAVLIVLVMVVSSIVSVYADGRGNHGDRGEGNYFSQGRFKDLEQDFWAYQAIMNLADLGIINGYTDGTFKPNGTVSRAEFASMLTKALKLTPADNSQTFADVAPSDWDFKAVEASKNYLTGYRTSNGTMYFYGSQRAVREDMAVALVKALNLALVSNNGQLQQVFSDYDEISPKLADYVYTAYIDGIMIGSDGTFKPQGKLTRAEAATLLLRALQKTEKVPVDGSSDSQKVPVDGSGQTTTTYDTDATLNSLAYNGTAIPGFNANTTTYNVALPAGTTAVPTVTAAVHDTGKATAYVTQAAALPGTAVIIVLAQDGTTQKVYKINFTVAIAPDTDATLSNLAYNGTAIPGFNANMTTYNMTLPYGTTAVPSVTAAVNDTGKATAIITQASALPGVATVRVTAQDGTTSKVYTVNFAVAAPDTDATLGLLQYNGIAVPEFSANTTAYNIALPAGTTAIPTVTAGVTDTGKAAAYVTQAQALPGVATVVVTAQDGTTRKVYTISFTVSAS